MYRTEFCVLLTGVVALVCPVGCDSKQIGDSTSEETKQLFRQETVVALNLSIWKDDVEAARKLLEENPGLDEFASPSIPSWFNVCAEHGAMQVGQMLLDRGWTANSTPGGRQIIPIWDANGKRFEMAQFLLKNGADPNRSRLLIRAINSREALKWVKLLVEYGADVNWCVSIAAEKPYWATPLSWAREAGKQDVVDYLLSKGAVLPDDPKANKRSDD